MTDRRILRAMAYGFALPLVTCMSQESMGIVTYRAVAAKGIEAPGVGSGVTFGDAVSTGFFSSSFNSSDKVAFIASFDGPGITDDNDVGVWSESGGTLHLVARSGDQAPGTTPGVFFGRRIGDAQLNEASSTSVPPVINAAGQVAFRSNLVGTGVDDTNDLGVWTEGSGTLALLARTNNQAPGTPTDVRFASFQPQPLLNNAGQSAFWGTISGPGVDSTNDQGVWSQGPGPLSLIARTGSTAPGVSNAIYTQLNDPALNNAGDVTFRGTISGTGIDSTNDIGIWSDASGTLELVARTGDPAPGTAAGVNFSAYQLPDSDYSYTNGTININDANQAAFIGEVTGPGVDSSNNQGIWAGDWDDLQLIAREGDIAPGTDGLRTFDEFSSSNIPKINNNGQVAFHGLLNYSGSSNDRYGVWATNPAGVLELVARTGDEAPGTGGHHFDFTFGAVAINNLGQVAFSASTDDNPTRDLGVWATDVYGNLVLVATEGDVVDANNDPLVEDLRQLSNRWLGPGGGNGEDGNYLRFNDDGQLVVGELYVFTVGISGDFNGDGFVGIDDLNLVLANWNQFVPRGDESSGDSSGDGFVGIDDLNTVLGNWNNGTPPSDQTNIPEPGMLMIIFAGAGWKLCRRDNR